MNNLRTIAEEKIIKCLKEGILENVQHIEVVFSKKIPQQLKDELDVLIKDVDSVKIDNITKVKMMRKFNDKVQLKEFVKNNQDFTNTVSFKEDEYLVQGEREDGANVGWGS